eukprot:Selendium_serpulae@DN3465_c0_g1_i3.p1
MLKLLPNMKISREAVVGINRAAVMFLSLLVKEVDRARSNRRRPVKTIEVNHIESVATGQGMRLAFLNDALEILGSGAARDDKPPVAEKKADVVIDLDAVGLMDLDADAHNDKRVDDVDAAPSVEENKMSSSVEGAASRQSHAAPKRAAKGGGKAKRGAKSQSSKSDMPITNFFRPAI